MQDCDRTNIRILMVSSVYPLPANTGGLIRIKEVLRGLARHHDVTFVCPQPTTTDASELIRMTGCRLRTATNARVTHLKRFRALLSPRPYHVALYASAKLKHLVADSLSRDVFDLVYVHFLRSLQFLPRNISIPVVLDQHNVDRDMWILRANKDPRVATRTISRVNAWKTGRYEDAAQSRIAAYVSVSRQDAARTRRYAHDARVIVAPNGVDIDHFAYVRRRGRRGSGGIRPVVAYMGSMDVPANIDAVVFLYREILPLVARRTGGVDLLVIGRNPARVLMKLKSTAMVRITITGTVDDVRPYLERAHIFVAPVFYGGGTKLKVLEAMACGLPVVATPHVADGIDATDGKHLLVGDDPQEFANAMLRLINDRHLYTRVATEGHKFVCRHYSWHTIVDGLAQELCSVTSRESNGASGAE